MISCCCPIWLFFNTEECNNIAFRILILIITVIRITVLGGDAELVVHLFCNQQQVSGQLAITITKLLLKLGFWLLFSGGFCSEHKFY